MQTQQQNLLPRKQRPKDAAMRYGVSVSSLYNYIQAGKLKITKPSKRVTLLDTMELEAFFNGESVEVA